jgi:hypothetical protein
MKYRLYIDEVGNPDLGASADPNHRYHSNTATPPASSKDGEENGCRENKKAPRRAPKDKPSTSSNLDC